MLFLSSAGLDTEWEGRERMKRFEGKSVVITGAASGIGRQTALEFARRAACLSLCDIDGEGLAGTRAAIEAMGAEINTEVVDVSKAWQVEEFCANTYRRFGSVDVLVNAAGVGVGGSFEDVPLSDWEWLIGANLWGVVHGCYYFYPRMLEQGCGHIVNIASGAGLGALPRTTAYCASKYSVGGFSEGLRAEAAPHGIKVTVVCPGIIATNVVVNARLRGGTARSGSEELREKIDRFFQKRGHPPEKVAAAVVRAVERNHCVVTVGAEARLLDLTHRLSRRLWGFALGLSDRMIHRFL